MGNPDGSGGGTPSSGSGTRSEQRVSGVAQSITSQLDDILNRSKENLRDEKEFGFVFYATAGVVTTGNIQEGTRRGALDLMIPKARLPEFIGHAHSHPIVGLPSIEDLQEFASYGDGKIFFVVGATERYAVEVVDAEAAQKWVQRIREAAATELDEDYRDTGITVTGDKREQEIQGRLRQMYSTVTGAAIFGQPSPLSCSRYLRRSESGMRLYRDTGNNQYRIVK